MLCGIEFGIYLNFVVIFRVAMLYCRKACDDSSACHFELSIESEKSTEFKIRLKALKSHFDFVDTSLCYAKFSMTTKKSV